MAKKSGHPLLPLLILILVLGFLALVGFVVYSIARDIAAKAAQKLEEHDVSFSKKGMEIKVKEMKEEDYVGATQSYLVKAWEYSSWPAYKSLLWNKPKAEEQKRGSVSGGGSGTPRASVSGVSGGGGRRR